MALQINPNGSTIKIRPRRARYQFTLSELQSIVGGYIEVVNLEYGWLVVNEEGLLQNLQLNILASAAAQRPIVGIALYCLYEDKEIS